MTALMVENLYAGYNGVPAVRDVSFRCMPGEVLSILGPNGAGKTTTLLAVAGCLQPEAGRVVLDGDDITGQAAYRIARLGLALVPDDRGLFPELTVAEHFRLVEGSAPARASTSQGLGRGAILDRFPQLRELMSRQCRLLSGGEQQMLAIAKALLLSPRVLLVDELSLGLAPIIVQGLLPALTSLSEEFGMALIVVEQHADLALAASKNALVMRHGEVVLSGAATDLLANPERLEAAYFGSAQTSTPAHAKHKTGDSPT